MCNFVCVCAACRAPRWCGDHNEIVRMPARLGPGRHRSSRAVCKCALQSFVVRCAVDRAHCILVFVAGVVLINREQNFCFKPVLLFFCFLIQWPRPRFVCTHTHTSGRGDGGLEGWRVPSVAFGGRARAYLFFCMTAVRFSAKRVLCYVHAG